jgi:hypothetical protein
MNATVQFISYTPEQLQSEISEGVKVQLQEFLKHFTPKQPNEYLTRSEVAKMFSIDISTVNNWNKSKRLKPLAMGGRIYYLRADLEASLTPLSV